MQLGIFFMEKINDIYVPGTVTSQGDFSSISLGDSSSSEGDLHSFIRRVKDQVKKYFILQVAMATAIGISIGNCASSAPANVSDNANKSISSSKVTMLTSHTENSETKVAGQVDNTNTDQKDIGRETYTALINDLMHIGDRSHHLNNKIDINGEIHYQNASNKGDARWDGDSSSIRARLDIGTNISEFWRINGMVENEMGIVNHGHKVNSRLDIEGKIGTSMLTAGSFGYHMGDGSIYDSGFKGVRFNFGDQVKCTLSYGDTNSTKDTSIATVRYDDFDYNLEASVYQYQLVDTDKRNTLQAISGKYNFSNFSLGAIYLRSQLKDSNKSANGGVLSFKYGELKSWRVGTYDIFAKYYNQSVGTYISPEMNGLGSRMQGFKGYGTGVHYAFATNFVGSIEYYRLTDKISGQKGQTLWSELSCYF